MASNFLNSPCFYGQLRDICPFAPQVQLLQSLKLSLARVWARLKVLLVWVLSVDLASARLDPWDETLLVLFSVQICMFCPWTWTTMTSAGKRFFLNSYGRSHYSASPFSLAHLILL
ncbi:UNVERIFIED_CONTAM: hypothetical protein Sindi_3030100 [Sesamum indicum]